MADLMKGKSWRDRKHTMSYPAWVEIKTDEIRAHVIVTPQGAVWPVQFLSYAGKPLHNLEHFASSFRNLALNTGQLEFDCGVEVNGNYNDSYRWVRSSKGAPEDLTGVPIKFLLFDLPLYEGCTMAFAERMTLRHNVAVMAHAEDFTELVQPYGEWAHSAEDVDKMFEAARKQGHEGLMVKSTTHTYQRGKRIDGWLKCKSEETVDGVVEGFTEAISEDGTPLGRAGSVHVRMEDGSRASPHGIAHELGRDMWENPAKYIGQWCELAFMERDRQGGYRHPVFRRLREAKA